MSDFIRQAKRRAVTRRILFLGAILMAMVALMMMDQWMYTHLFANAARASF